MSQIIQIRRGLAADAASVNPTLAEGEFGYTLDTKILKIGNGFDPWNDLPAFTIPIEWVDILDVPATFPPSAHNHDASYEAKNVNIQAHIVDTGNPHGVTKAQVGLGAAENTADIDKPLSTAQSAAISAAIAGVINASPAALDTLKELADAIGDDANFAATVTTALAGKQPLDSDLTAIAALTTTSFGRSLLALADAAALRSAAALGSLATQSGTFSGTSSGTNTGDQDTSALAPKASPAFSGTVTGITAAMVGLGSVDNVLDVNKPVSTAQAAADAVVKAAIPNASYRTILDSSGSHTAAKVAGTYAMGQSSPIAVSGTGTLIPINTIFIAAADYPTVDGKAPKLRIRCNLYSNDVAPFTGTFTIGLFPITRPGTSGGTGLCIYTLGTVVSGSNGAVFTNPAADGLLNAVGSDFALPADGHYVIGVVTSATMATSSHVHISASLQLRNA